MSNNKWAVNITKISPGIFTPMNGNANQLIAIGRVIKAGFVCSQNQVKNLPYNAVIEIPVKKDQSQTQTPKLLRVHIMGTSLEQLSFKTRERGGKEHDKTAPSRSYKYSKTHCDIILGINSNNGECYIIPIEDTEKFKNTMPFSDLKKYKENWEILKTLAESK